MSIDFEDFEKKAREAKLFLLCSPHNPLGIVWTKEQLKKMADICIANDVLLVSDEIHSGLRKHLDAVVLYITRHLHIKKIHMSRKRNLSAKRIVIITVTEN